MKLGILGDIHGNIEALKVAYEEAISNKVEKIYHLGDLGGYAPYVNEVADFLMERQIEGVQGNYDETVANDREHCGCKYEDPIQEKMATQSFEWTKKHVIGKTKEYMKNLPLSISFSSHSRKIAIFHATPSKNNMYWYEERPDKFFLDMAKKTDADILIYGHTHKPYRKDLNNKIFINVGSVGKPKDGDTRTCVTIIDISSDNVKTDFVRIPYDLEKVASAIEKSELPSYFAEKLRSGA